MNKSIYKPVFIRKYQLIAVIIRQLSKLLTLWPLLVLVWVLIVPVSPHMLVTYRYVGHYPNRHKTDCDYLGIKGWVVQNSYGGDCSFIRLINPNKPQAINSNTSKSTSTAGRFTPSGLPVYECKGR